MFTMKLTPPKIDVGFALVFDLDYEKIWCIHAQIEITSPEFVFGFAFVILTVINSEIFLALL